MAVPTNPAELREQRYQESLRLREREERAEAEKKAAKRAAKKGAANAAPKRAAVPVETPKVRPSVPKVRRAPRATPVEAGPAPVVEPAEAAETITLPEPEEGAVVEGEDGALFTVTRTGYRDDDLTREGWLLQAIEAMRPDFVAVGREVPEVRVSMGWPGGRSARLDPLGQCWHPSTVGDGIHAIFVTPSQDDPVQVLATTRHEMVHAAGEMNHRAGFRKLAAQVGFDPQPGATGVSSTYRTPALQEKLEALYAELGPFPHSPVNKGVSTSGKPAVQTTRMLKVACEEVEFDDDNEPQVCGYTVRTTAKWLAVAIPHCPVHPDVEMIMEVK